MERNANGSRTIVGDLYPGANILGVDLRPIQPAWVPLNVKFMVNDVESSWLRPLNYFDYIPQGIQFRLLRIGRNLCKCFRVRSRLRVPLSVFPFLQFS